MKNTIYLSLFAIIVAACTTTPTGRSQLNLVGEGEMASMGAQSFNQMKSQLPISKDPRQNAYVQCIAKALLQVMNLNPSEWEVVVFQDKTPNAFALPGNKIGVHTGMLEVAKNQDQLAAVIGHEVGHVLAHHGAERMSQALVTQSGLAIASTALKMDSPKGQLMMAALGMGAQVGVLLPFSRKQEAEADEMGADYMAKAGFNPAESVRLWVNMSAAGGGAPPEFLSTHPSSSSRIQHLENLQAKLQPTYQAAHQAGRRPQCRL